MTNLKPCPCGEVPTQIICAEYKEKSDIYAAVADCCTNFHDLSNLGWSVLFEMVQRENTTQSDADHMARQAWNAAPRKEKDDEN